MAEILFLLLVAHCVADYPLQGDFLARGKQTAAPLPGVPPYLLLVSHALIQAGGVMLVTGSLSLGLAELIAHVGIDEAKNHGLTTFGTDQALHALCKVAWTFAMFTG